MCESLNMIKQQQQKAKIRTSEILVFWLFAVCMVKTKCQKSQGRLQVMKEMGACEKLMGPFSKSISKMSSFHQRPEM